MDKCGTVEEKEIYDEKEIDKLENLPISLKEMSLKKQLGELMMDSEGINRSQSKISKSNFRLKKFPFYGIFDIWNSFFCPYITVQDL